jgi:hypothetical protein
MCTPSKRASASEIFPDRALDRADHAGQCRGGHLQRDRTRFEWDSRAFVDDGEDLDEVAREVRMCIGRAEGGGQLARAPREDRIVRGRAHEAQSPIQFEGRAQVADDVPHVVQVADLAHATSVTAGLPAVLPIVDAMSIVRLMLDFAKPEDRMA